MRAPVKTQQGDRIFLQNANTSLQSSCTWLSA